MARAVLLLAHPLLSLAQTLLELVQLGKQPPPGVALRHLGNSLMMMAASWTRKDVGALPAFPRAGYPVMARHHRMLQGSPPRQASPAGTARNLRNLYIWLRRVKLSAPAFDGSATSSCRTPWERPAVEVDGNEIYSATTAPSRGAWRQGFWRALSQAISILSSRAR
uniref:Putative secreted protein n=1 Tax=Ixodes ricinus TaxID=34613 RepID=A0A6B0UXB5_IXORI